MFPIQGSYTLLPFVPLYHWGIAPRAMEPRWGLRCHDPVCLRCCDSTSARVTVSFATIAHASHRCTIRARSFRHPAPTPTSLPSWIAPVPSPFSLRHALATRTASPGCTLCFGRLLAISDDCHGLPSMITLRLLRDLALVRSRTRWFQGGC